MKHISRILIVLFSFIISGNVYAECQKTVLKDLKIDGIPVGKSSIVNSSGTEYKITVKENVKTVRIDASTDYAFVDGYGPRTVSTNETVQIRVNGAPECGITRYYLSFVKESETTTTQKSTTTNTTTTTSTSTTSTTTTTTTTTTRRVEQEDESQTAEVKVKLKSLSIEGYPLNYNPTNDKYIIEVASDVSSLNIIPEKENESDNVVISENANNLPEGTSIVTVTVTNQEGNSNVYEITVIKKSDESRNNYLSQLAISGYSIPFDPETTEYYLTIKDETSLNISAIPQADTSSVSISNNSNLVNGSKIIITVKAENGSQREYTINIRKNEFDIMTIIKDYWQILLVGLLVIIIIIILVIMLIKSKKKKKKESVTPEEINVPENTSVVSNTVDASPNVSVPQNINPTPVQPPIGDLEIITPNVNEENKEDNTSNTEVFKL